MATAELTRQQLLIGGKWADASSGASYEQSFPFTGDAVGVAAAAKGSMPLIVFGLIVSIPIVIVGSQIIMKLIQRFPILVMAGGGLLGYVAGEMMVADPAIAPWLAANAAKYTWLAPIAGVAVVVAVGYALTHRRAVSEA